MFEKSQNLLLLPCNLDWSDVWTFDSLYRILSEGNCSLRSLDSRGNLVIETGKKLVVLIRIEDTTVVDTEDVLLLVKNVRLIGLGVSCKILRTVTRKFCKAGLRPIVHEGTLRP